MHSGRNCTQSGKAGTDLVNMATLMPADSGEIAQREVEILCIIVDKPKNVHTLYS